VLRDGGDVGHRHHQEEEQRAIVRHMVHDAVLHMGRVERMALRMRVVGDGDERPASARG